LHGGANLTDADGTHNYWTVGDTYTADADQGEGMVVEETHTAKNTLNATVMTMSQWIAAGRNAGPFWVYDTDGWAYWAEVIEPGTATGLLLNGITPIAKLKQLWFYGINVEAQFATADDMSEFYDEANGAAVQPGSSAEYLLKQAMQPRVTSITVSSTPSPAVFDINTTDQIIFKSTVRGQFLDGNTDIEKVTWSISPTTHGGTFDTATGILTGATVAGNYTVKATSSYDNTKSGTLSVSVVNITPVVATTRYIPAANAGDTSDWLEIATHGDYSLIVRKSSLSTTVASPGTTYSSSAQRTGVNTWFAGSTTLAADAPLRDYALQNNALSDRGVFANRTAGFSKPKAGTTGATGDDTAFVASFAEMAAFSSLKYHPGAAPYPASPAEAQTNYNAFTFDHAYLEIGRSTATYPIYCNALRNPSDSDSNLLGLVGGASTGTSGPYYIRPMMWVDADAGAALFENR
jgi:hypothetical protein